MWSLVIVPCCRPVRRGGQGVDSGVFESVAGVFEGKNFGVMNDAVDHGCGDDLVTEYVAPKGRLEVKISEACS
jgi:hypothetical protein